MLGDKEIEDRFETHVGSTSTQQKHQRLRESFIAFGKMLDEVLPAGRESAVTFTNLEDASMWAHKALARSKDR